MNTTNQTATVTTRRLGTALGQFLELPESSRAVIHRRVLETLEAARHDAQAPEAAIAPDTVWAWLAGRYDAAAVARIMHVIDEFDDMHAVLATPQLVEAVLTGDARVEYARFLNR